MPWCTIENLLENGMISLMLLCSQLTTSTFSRKTFGLKVFGRFCGSLIDFTVLHGNILTVT